MRDRFKNIFLFLSRCSQFIAVNVPARCFLVCLLPSPQVALKLIGCCRLFKCAATSSNCWHAPTNYGRKDYRSSVPSGIFQLSIKLLSWAKSSDDIRREASLLLRCRQPPPSETCHAETPLEPNTRREPFEHEQEAATVSKE